MALYKDLTDIELAKMLQEADAISSGAFAELYNRYWKKLLAVAFNRLGSLDEAEETVQEVFYNLWKRRATLQLMASPATYLATAVKYEIINRLAKIQRGADYREHVQRHSEAFDNSTQEWLVFEDLRVMIAHTVKALPEKCRIVYQLSREKGYTHQQIATELNISLKTVESHLFKAMKTLRSTLRNFLALLLMIQ